MYFCNPVNLILENTWNYIQKKIQHRRTYKNLVFHESHLVLNKIRIQQK